MKEYNKKFITIMAVVIAAAIVGAGLAVLLTHSNDTPTSSYNWDEMAQELNERGGAIRYGDQTIGVSKSTDTSRTNLYKYVMIGDESKTQSYSYYQGASVVKNTNATYVYVDITSRTYWDDNNTNDIYIKNITLKDNYYSTSLTDEDGVYRGYQTYAYQDTSTGHYWRYYQTIYEPSIYLLKECTSSYQLNEVSYENNIMTIKYTQTKEYTAYKVEQSEFGSYMVTSEVTRLLSSDIIKEININTADIRCVTFNQL